MGLETIRGILGQLQADAELDSLWDELKVAAHASDDGESLVKLLTAARHAHARRGEWDAVARLLALEMDAETAPEAKLELLLELARVQQHELLDEAAALASYRLVLAERPDDELLLAALAESEERREKWEEMATTYRQEADAAPDDIYKASMLMRAAEMEWRFAGADRDPDRVLGLLAQAAEADPKNTTVLQMLERVYRHQGQLAPLPAVLERWSQATEEASQAVAPALRLARLLENRLGKPEAAARAYELALEAAPAEPESKDWLVSYYSQAEDWDRLVLVYERGLSEADLGRVDRVGDMLQIALLHQKKRGNESDALAWFEKIRAVEPTNGAMLDFYRTYCVSSGNEGLLLEVLRQAQRVLPSGDEKNAVTQEIAKLAESQEDAQQAIEQYKALLRQDPENAEARGALKSLYRRTQGYHQLVDLLQHELERLPESARDERLAILSEVAGVYRDHIPHDTSLVSALTQILKTDEGNVAAVRELIGLYARLERWRDLLTNQQRLSVLSQDEEERVALLRDSGRRWLEQFSNVQNATLAFESLLELRPDDREARDTLANLYKKRRAWPALYKLYDAQLASLEGPQRIAVMKEMAELAADRLGNRDTAAKLYKQILEMEPANLTVVDALERQAERAKDWATLASALEHRAGLALPEGDRVAVLQKLGTVYQDHLKSSPKAIDAWQRVLALQPGHARAVRVLRDAFLASEDYAALEALYEQQGDHESLAEVLSNTADRATDIRTKIDLSYRAARVYEEVLNKPERAFRCYERIMAVDPLDTRAAQALVPLYERDEKWARLPALYQLLIDESSSRDDKLALYEKLIDVTAQRLSDRKGAVVFARKAYELDPERPEALELFERACAAADAWEPYAEALEARLQLHRESVAPPPKGGRRRRRKGSASAPDEKSGDDALTSPTVSRLELKLAQTYARRLGRIDDAVVTYKRLLESHPENDVAGGELEALLLESGKNDELRWLQGFRVENAGSDESALKLMHEWAVVEETRFSDKSRAAELYRRILEQSPEDEGALSELSRLLLVLNDDEGALEVLAHHRDLTQEDKRAALETQMASVLLERLKRPEEALEACVRAIELGSEAESLTEMLRTLSQEATTRARASEVLAEVYHRSGESRREAEALVALLATEVDSARRLELYVRAVGVFEQLDSYGSAFATMLSACREFPHRIELWDRVTVLGEQAARPTELAEAYRDVLQSDVSPDVALELCKRAASLHTEQLGDPVGATPYLERVLALEPADESAFIQLKQILTSNQRWGELQTLYDRATRAVSDPATKLQILAEVAMVSEEFVENPVQAEAYYEQMLALDPDSSVALDALDRLYLQHGKLAQLEKVLEHRLHLETAGEQATQYRLRLAELYLDQLHQPAKALPHLGAVLSQDVNDLRGRELTERILDIGSLRGDAAEILEPVYLARDQIRDLVRVLEVRADVLRDVPERDPDQEHDFRELLARLAELMDQRLRDDEAALRVMAEYVPLAPADELTREKLIQTGRRLNAPSQVAEVLERAGEQADDAVLQGEIWLQAAALLDADADSAERLYKRVLSVSADSAHLALPAARALEGIFAQAERHEALVDNLRIQLELGVEPDERVQLLGRIARLSESKLDDSKSAIECWKERLELDLSDLEALTALDRLYEATEQWPELSRILELRRDRVSDSGERKVLLGRSARLFAGPLEDNQGAIEAYRAILDEAGPDVAVLEALEAILRKEERWQELADVCESHLAEVQAPAAQLELLVTLGALKQDRLSDVPGALDAYRAALVRDPKHARAREALGAILRSEDRLHRRDAAEILRPVFEQAGEAKELLETLLALADTAELPEEKLGSLKQAIAVADEQLGDAEVAFELAGNALEVAAGHADLRPWLSLFDTLAAKTGHRAKQVEVLQAVVDDIFDGDVQFEVTECIARLARDELDDAAMALTYYQRAVELRSDSDPSLAALELLYEASADNERLLQTIERRADLVAGTQAAVPLLFRRAALLDGALKDPDAASQVLETILDIEFSPDAVNKLAELYARQGRWDDLVELHQRELAQPGVDESEVRLSIARVAAWKLEDPFRAFEQLEIALSRDGTHAGVVVELERLLEEAAESQHRAHAAALLEPLYLARADYDRVIATRKARLENADAPDERRNLLVSLAQIYEEQKEDYGEAFETTAQLLAEDLDDEDTLGELERLARVAEKTQRLAEVYARQLEDVSGAEQRTITMARRAGEIYRDSGQLEGALKYFRQAMDYDPDDRTLFSAVDDLLERLERHEELVELHSSAIALREDAAERVAHLHKVAELQSERLGDKGAAIASYVDLLTLDPTDARALDTLSRLYFETGRFEDLYDLVLSRAEGAPDQRKAASYRLALARLCRDELGDDDRAIAQLEEIVLAVPGHPEAIAELEAYRKRPEHTARCLDILQPLYHAADNWQRLIALNEDRFRLAELAIDKVMVLRETANLWESRGREPQRAVDALAEAIRIAPDDDDVRGEYERLIESTGNWDELAELYAELLNDGRDIHSAREMWAKLAACHDENRDDPRAALEAYASLHKVDDTDLEVVERMESLATLLSDWEVLDWVLVAKAGLVLEDGERASLWRRVAEGRRDMLGRAGGAIEAYERALDFEPDSTFTLDCLVALLEEAGKAERLVELYLRRVELTEPDEPEIRFDHLRRAAKCYRDHFGDKQRAIELFTLALDEAPNDDETLSDLTALYRGEALWPELVENLATRAELATDAEVRGSLNRERGDVLSGKLEHYDEALDAFELVLTEHPEDAQARRSVRAIGEQHEELRERVARVLLPALERSKDYEQIVEVLELRLSNEGDPLDRARTLRAIARTLEVELGASGRAHEALRRAMAEVPEDDSVHAELERLCDSRERWAVYADALGERASNLFDAELAKDLFVRLGELAERRLEDPARAIEAYTQAIAQVGDTPELLATLDGLLDRTERWTELGEVLERRTVLVESDAERAELYQRLGLLQIDRFDELGQGLESLRIALELNVNLGPACLKLEELTSRRDLFEEVAQLLESVYRGRGDVQQLTALGQKRVDHAETVEERLEMRKSLARILEEEMADTPNAQRVLESALVDCPTDEGLLLDLERLAQVTGDWGALATAVQSALQGNDGVPPEDARDLCVRVAGWYSERLDDAAAAERALHEALSHDKSSEDVLLRLEELQSLPGREVARVETLRLRARLQYDEAAREELYREAVAVAEGVSESALVESVLTEQLEHSPGNVWALESLAGCREKSDDFEGAFALLVRLSEASFEGEEIAAVRHRAAELAVTRLAAPGRALELYERIFEDDVTDRKAASALLDLYAQEGRHKARGELLLRLVEVTDSITERGKLRLQLARLQNEQFKSGVDAIATLKDLLLDDPENSDAAVELSRLLESEGLHGELAEHLVSQADAALGRGDTAALLRLELRLAEVCEGPLGDPARAAETYLRILDAEPGNQTALQALTRLYLAAEDLDSAADMLVRRVELAEGPEQTALARELAELHLRAGSPEQAVATLEFALEQSPGEQAIRESLRQLYGQTEAWDRLGELLVGDAELQEDATDRARLLNEAARVFIERTPDLARGAELLEAAAKLAPEDRGLLLQLCEVYNDCGRGEDAVRTLEQIVESYGGRRSKELGDIHRRLADAYLAQGEQERAAEELNKAFRIEPGNVLVLKALGILSLESGDLKRAQQMFRALRLEKLGPDSPISEAQVFYYLAIVHDRMDDTARAKHHLESALRLEPNLTEAAALLDEIQSR